MYRYQAICCLDIKKLFDDEWQWRREEEEESERGIGDAESARGKVPWIREVVLKAVGSWDCTWAWEASGGGHGEWDALTSVLTRGHCRCLKAPTRLPLEWTHRVSKTLSLSRLLFYLSQFSLLFTIFLALFTILGEQFSSRFIFGIHKVTPFFF